MKCKTDNYIKNRRLITAAKRVAAIIISLAVFTVSGKAAFAQKSETVYAKLGNSGEVECVYVVNRLAGSYTDYGSYTDIKNLSTTSVPKIEGDKISFPDAYVEGGLYYQGTVKSELPLSVNISWTLNGTPIAAEELSGADGKLNIDIDCKPNELCNENVRKGLTAQISVPLNTKKAENIKSNGASVTNVGNTATVSHIILPGESGKLTIEAEIKDFEMEPITIALVSNKLSAYLDDINALEDGLAEMIDGAKDMSGGMSELKSGTGSLTKGAKKLSEGLKELSANGMALSDGISKYEDGLNKYFGGIENVAPASLEIKNGLNSLAQNGQGLSDGIKAISGGLKGISSSSSDLKLLAQSLLSSEDEQVRALAHGAISLVDGVGLVSGNLSAASDNLGDYMLGVNQTATGYAALNDAIAAIAQGAEPLRKSFASLNGGVKSYAQGVSQGYKGAQRIYKYLKRVPKGIQELMDAQEEFRNGLNEIKDGLDESPFLSDDNPIVSFVSPDKNKPASVQYVMMSKGIEKSKQPVTIIDNGKDKTVVDRFLDLFR